MSFRRLALTTVNHYSDVAIGLPCRPTLERLQMYAANPAIKRLLGVTAAQARGRLASEVFPGIQPAWTESFDRVVREGRLQRLERLFGPLGRGSMCTPTRRGANAS